MRILILYITLFSCISCERSKTLEVKNVKGEVTAIWTYEKDTLTGVKKTFYENGSARAILRYANGKLHGKYQEFFDNGFIARAGEFRNGKLRGQYFEYSQNNDGAILREEYILNANGRNFFNYVKEYDESGTLVNHQRLLIIELDDVSVKKSAVFKYVGAFRYDSLKLITGKFSVDFDRLSELDSTTFINDIAIVPIKSLGLDSVNVTRGQLIGYSGSIRADTIVVRRTVHYFEQDLKAMNKIGTEIKLSPDFSPISLR